MQALQQHVKQHGSPTAYAHVATLDAFPVAISRYYIRLDGSDKNTANKVNKLLIIDVTFKG